MRDETHAHCGDNMWMKRWIAMGAAIGLLMGCSETSGDKTKGEDAASAGGDGDAASQSEDRHASSQGGAFAVPQEELARKKDAIKVKGTISVEGYESGLLQIDVTKPVEGDEKLPRGVPPLTVARFKSPGPFELLLPAGTEAVNLSVILDLKGDGPSAEDPKAAFEGNPLTISGSEVEGVELKVSASEVEPPPTPPRGNQADQAPSTDASAGTTQGEPATEADAAPKEKVADSSSPEEGNRPPAESAQRPTSSPPDATPALTAKKKNIVDALDESLDDVPRAAQDAL